MLAFVIERAYLCSQLSSYQKSWFIKNGNRASSFSHAISQTNNRNEIQELIYNQVKVLQGNNPYQESERDQEYKKNINSNAADKYHFIISFWNKLDKDAIKARLPKLIKNVDDFKGVLKEREVIKAEKESSAGYLSFFKPHAMTTETQNLDPTFLVDDDRDYPVTCCERFLAYFRK